MSSACTTESQLFGDLEHIVPNLALSTNSPQAGSTDVKVVVVCRSLRA
jgi:hypothetical protein